MKNFAALFLLALAPVVSASADDKVYLTSNLVTVTDDGITLSLLNENISLEALYADEGGIYVLSDELYAKGYWQCGYCNEYHPNNWDSCPLQNQAEELFNGQDLGQLDLNQDFNQDQDPFQDPYQDPYQNPFGYQNYGSDDYSDYAE